MPSGPYFILQTGTGLQQLFDDLQMIRARFVDGRPDGCVEDIASVHASWFERSFPLNEQPHRFQLPTVHGPMECVQASAGAARWIEAVRQQVRRHAGPAEKPCARQRFRQRLLFSPETALFVPVDNPCTPAARFIVEQRLEPRKVSIVEPLKGISKHGVVIVAGLYRVLRDSWLWHAGGLTIGAHPRAASFR